jgi:hypothetical protein
MTGPREQENMTERILVKGSNPAEGLPVTRVRSVSGISSA